MMETINPDTEIPTCEIIIRLFASPRTYWSVRSVATRAIQLSLPDVPRQMFCLAFVAASREVKLRRELASVIGSHHNRSSQSRAYWG